MAGVQVVVRSGVGVEREAKPVESSARACVSRLRQSVVSVVQMRCVWPLAWPSGQKLRNIGYRPCHPPRAYIGSYTRTQSRGPEPRKRAPRRSAAPARESRNVAKPAAHADRRAPRCADRDLERLDDEDDVDRRNVPTTNEAKRKTHEKAHRLPRAVRLPARDDGHDAWRDDVNATSTSEVGAIGPSVPIMWALRAMPYGHRTHSTLALTHAQNAARTFRSRARKRLAAAPLRLARSVSP